MRTVFAGFADDQAIVAVRRPVDLKSAPELGAYFEVLFASGYPAVVLDLSAMESIDAAGLAVIVSAASSLAASGGALTIRSSSNEVARVLDAKLLAEMISRELPGPSPNQLAREQLASVPSKPPTGAPPDVPQHLRMLQEAPANEAVLDDALRLVVALARIMVGGADGASVTLRRRGSLRTVAASDQTVSEMDANQYATGEGPCVDASVAGHCFYAQSLEEEKR
jgi:anti-anti-sigma factor